MLLLPSTMLEWMLNLNLQRLARQFSQGTYSQVVGMSNYQRSSLSLLLDYTLDRYEGLVLPIGGNGRSYVLILEAGPLADTTQSKVYFARIITKAGFCWVRVPFSAFRPVNPDDPALDPFLVHTLTIRFEPRRQGRKERKTAINSTA